MGTHKTHNSKTAENIVGEKKKKEMSRKMKYTKWKKENQG